MNVSVLASAALSSSEPPAIAAAYRDAAEHLHDHLQRLAWCIERLELVRLVAELGGPGHGHLQQLERLEQAILACDHQIATREAGAIAAGRRLPVSTLVERFALSPAALHFLLAAALPALDVELGRRFAALVGSHTEHAAHELVELLAFDDHDQAVVMAQAEARAPLSRHHLVRLFPAKGYLGETPIAHRRVSVPERVVAYLRGDETFRGEAFRHVAYQVTSDLAYQVTNDATNEAMNDAQPLTSEPSPASLTLRRMLITGERPIVVVGAAQIGKLTAIAAAASALGRTVVAAELEGVLASPEPLVVLGELLRERRLLDAVLVLRLGEAAAIPAGVEREVIDLANAGELVLTARDGGALLRKLRAPKVVRVGLPSADAQARLWRAQLALHAGAGAMEVGSLVHRYPLGPGDICAAAQAATAVATVERRGVSGADLVTAARHRLQHLLGDVAELVSTTLTWEDLVLREEVIQRILEVVAAVRFREQVLGRWGFAAKMPYGRSVTALFSGPPGTGKTMVATLIAQELGLELFRIDLSKVVSKWIGETEKNLSKVFDQAQSCGAVLLFDEADSLFAKRTEVKSSNDRYANLEVNYLLQRLEAYDGIALLTTNHLSSIDPAFLRRIRFRVEFPEPDEREREALWRTMIPRSAPLTDDVDFAALARRFKVAGGHIKNAAIRAAFLAAGHDAHAITHDLLALAAQLEWTELGNLPK